jgi:hypothetical protein
MTATGDMKLITEFMGTQRPNHAVRVSGSCTQSKEGTRHRNHRHTCKVESVAVNDLKASAAQAHHQLRVGGRQRLQWVARLFPVMRTIDELSLRVTALLHQLQPSTMPQAKRGVHAFALPEPTEPSAALGLPVLSHAKYLGGLSRAVGRASRGATVTGLAQHLGNISDHGIRCTTADAEADGLWDHTTACLEGLLIELGHVSEALGRQGVGGSGALHCALAVKARVCRAADRATVTNARVPADVRPMCWPGRRNFETMCGRLLFAVNPGDAVFYLDRIATDADSNSYGVDDRCNGYATPFNHVFNMFGRTGHTEVLQLSHAKHIVLVSDDGETGRPALQVCPLADCSPTHARLYRAPIMVEAGCVEMHACVYSAAERVALGALSLASAAHLGSIAHVLPTLTLTLTGCPRSSSSRAPRFSSTTPPAQTSARLAGFPARCATWSCAR